MYTGRRHGHVGVNNFPGSFRVCALTGRTRDLLLITYLLTLYLLINVSVDVSSTVERIIAKSLMRCVRW